MSGSRCEALRGSAGAEGRGSRGPVLAMVQLPPPVHGVTVMNRQVAESWLLRERCGLEVLPLRFAERIDDVGKVRLGKLRSFGGTLLALAARCARDRPRLAYLTVAPTGAALYRDALFIALLRTFGVPTVFHLHGKGIRSAAVDPARRILYRWLFRNTHVIHLSPSMREEVEAFVPPERFHALPNGIEDPAPELLRTFGADRARKPHVLFLSNLSVEKGPLLLLNALGRLRARGIEFRASFAGAWVRRDCADEFARLRKHLDLEPVVEYLGPKYGAEKHRLFREADVFVLPSFYPAECFPLVLLEAMAFGLPIVSTPEGAIPDIVEQGATGFLVAQKDASALAERLEVLIADPDLRERMGRRARQRFEERFTKEVFEQRLCEILTGILADSDGGWREH